jgi:uncharacterized damage-inducible protein DinB
MTTPQQLAKHLRDFYNGGNWTAVNLKDTLEGITWEQAVTKVHDFNTIAMLLFHINYYVDAVIKVFQGNTLKASDKYAFDVKPITSEKDWQQLKDHVFSQAEVFAALIESMDEKKLPEVFEDAKYGTYFRNILGIIEHAHYHLGQIMLIKKILNVPSPIQSETP